MKFNTDTLGYKLLSGSLKSKRVHSEQLNKYLAGLFDADGCVTTSATSSKGKRRVRLLATITQSASNDPDFSLIRALRDFYGIGSLTYAQARTEKDSHSIEWRFSNKDAEVLFNIIGKHLMIKGTHFRRMIELRGAFQSIEPSDSDLLSIASFRKISREHSEYLKKPKHISVCWLAGMLDGDGYLRCRIGRRVFNKASGNYFTQNNLHATIALSEYDSSILKMLSVTFGGKVDTRNKISRWTIGLGKGNKQRSVKLLSKLVKFSCLEKKYLILERMIEFHKEPAETKHEASES